MPNKEDSTKVTEKAPDNIFEEKEDDSKEYIDHRIITISLVHNYSNYRKVNMKVLGQRKETIGSSITSCRVLSSNRGEVEAYFPALIGLSPNNPNFITRVKAWLSNIQFVVNDNDAPLDISFVYNTKKDYLIFKAREDAIDAEYNKTDRTNTTKIKEVILVLIPKAVLKDSVTEFEITWKTPPQHIRAKITNNIPSHL